MANKKPNAEDFIAVSMAMVREEISPNPVSRGKKYPTRPPTKCNNNTGIWSLMPACKIGSATWATALATNKHVLTTPTTGAKGKIFSMNLGKNLFAVMPTAMGAKTT